jgi:hypothetical protein
VSAEDRQPTYAELQEQVALLTAALRPFAAFGKAFDAKPMRGIADEVYAIHAGTQWAASLRLSDCRRAQILIRNLGLEEP